MKNSGRLPLIKKLLKKKEEGFSLIELVVVVAVLSALSAVAIPQFNCYQRKAKASTALAAMRQIQTECAINTARTGSSGTYSTGNLNSYQIQSNGSNSCSGAQNTGIISAIPNNTSQLPTFLLATNNTVLTYNFRGINGSNFSNLLTTLCSSGSSNFSRDKYNDFEFVISNAAINNDCSDYAIVQASSWDEAEANANSLGGNLITINSEDEYTWLQQNLWKDNKLLKEAGINSNESTYFYTGLNDVNEEGNYVWSSGEESQWNNNEDLIHRQNWIAQQYMANSNDYFVIGGTNDYGFTDFVQEDYRPDLYTGVGVGNLTWVDNESSWLRNNGNPPHYGIAEIPTCRD
tara:strand:+ start:226 stop:1266 length:1041 start_codon:yes stop_codon:yes gene_type:complete